MFRPKLAYEPLSVLDCKVIASARSVPRGVEVGQMREYRQERRKVCAERADAEASGELAAAASLRPWLAIPSLGRLRART